MFIKNDSNQPTTPLNIVNCSGGGACNVGSATDCKYATGNAKNEGSHNKNVEDSMSSSPGK